MPDTRTPSYFVKRSFTDFDQLAFQARQWDLDLSQLDCGDFYGELLQFGIGNVHVSEARFCRSLIQKGTPPERLRTFAIAATKNIRFSWRGNSVDDEHVLVFPRGSELHAVSNPEFHVYTCSIPEDLIGIVSDSLGVDSLDALAGDTGVVRGESLALDSLRRCLHELCETARKSTTELGSVRSLRLATVELPRRLIRALASSGQSHREAKLNNRAHALILAETFVEQFASEAISVGDIARAAQVSQRTLEYAFRERYRLTPKAFLKAYRLGTLRRFLLAADPNCSKVSEIASGLGFWHMGQLAADYRKQFNELPSDTLRRVKV